MRAIKTISVTPEFVKLAQMNHLSWTEASRIGMGLMLADRGLIDYNPKIYIYRKMMLYKKQLEEVLSDMDKLKEVR